MRSFFRRATDKLDDPRFVRRVSKAGLALVLIWLVVLTTYNGIEGNRRLNSAQGREQALLDDLQVQRELTQETIDQLVEVQLDLDVTVAQNEALAEQIRQLGGEPVAGMSPDSTGGSDSPSGGTPGPTGPQGPQGTPGQPPQAAPNTPTPPPTTQPPQPNPRDEGLIDVPPLLEPVCDLTGFLGLCR